jgi:hypothetical protein
MRLYAVLKYLLKSPFPYPLSEADEATRVKREPVFKTPRPAEIPHVRIFYPGFCRCFIAGIFQTLQSVLPVFIRYFTLSGLF